MNSFFMYDTEKNVPASEFLMFSSAFISEVHVINFEILTWYFQVESNIIVRTIPHFFGKCEKYVLYIGSNFKFVVPMMVYSPSPTISFPFPPHSTAPPPNY